MICQQPKLHIFSSLRFFFATFILCLEEIFWGATEISVASFSPLHTLYKLADPRKTSCSMLQELQLVTQNIAKGYTRIGIFRFHSS